MHLGDFALETTVHCKFTTRSFTTGAPTVLAGTPAVEIYEDNSTTQITAAGTLTVDFDAIVGLNHLAIAATAANGFEAGKFYQAVISAGTVGGVSVVGEVIAQFTIQATSALRPTIAGRTLDVSAGGEAGVDWANVGSPTTTVGLSGTTVKTATDVETDTADIQSRLPAALVSGRIDASVGAMAANVMTAAAAAADLTTELQSGLATAAALDAVDNFVDTEVAAIKTVVDAIQAKTDNLPVDPADASVIAGRFDTLDTSVADLPTNAELATALGTADDAVLAQVALVKTETDKIASIKTKTDSLTFTAAGQVDANVQYVNDVQVGGVGTEGNPWGPA